MVKISDATLSIINSPVRQITARVELYNSAGIETEEEAGATLVGVFSHNGALINFTVDRVGDESKFFGFGIFQKINVKLRDLNREININTSHYLRVVYTVNGEDIAPYPFFKVSETHRDELTNELSITGYDALNDTKDSLAPLSELTDYITEQTAKTYEVGLVDIMYLVADILGTPADINTVGEYFNIKYTDIAEINLDANSTFKEMLDALAEATHSIYFINGINNLVFESLSEYGSIGVEYIDKSKYFSLDTKENRRLSTVIHPADGVEPYPRLLLRTT